MNKLSALHKTCVEVTGSSHDLAEASAHWIVDEAGRSMLKRVAEARDLSPILCWPVGNTQTQDGGLYELLADSAARFIVDLEAASELQGRHNNYDLIHAYE